MTKRLYVGNLPYSVTETALREMFAAVGEVTNVAVITDRETGRAKGFAFVEMSTDDLAKEAITQLNGKSLDERTITVAEAREQTQRDTYGGGGGGYGGGGGRRGGGGGGGYGGGRGGGYGGGGGRGGRGGRR
jgi:RNA recognition motif-containing protein